MITKFSNSVILHENYSNVSEVYRFKSWDSRALCQISTLYQQIARVEVSEWVLGKKNFDLCIPSLNSLSFDIDLYSANDGDLFFVNL